jgi:DNA-binding LytR/AlgR family response regulator
MAVVNRPDNVPATRASRLPSGIEFAYRELCTVRLIVISLGISCFWVVFLTVAGPGSDLLTDPMLRAAYFGAMAALTLPLGHSMSMAVLYCLRRCRYCPVAIVSIVAGLYVAANIATVGYGLYVMMKPAMPLHQGWHVLFLRAAIASVVHITAIQYLAVQRAKLRPLMDSMPSETQGDRGGTVTASATKPSSAHAPEVPKRFLDRLPENVGHDVVYLRVNGHYINVVTTDGTAAVLMRFADAVVELGNLGLQVHRSFWVAHRHVSAVAQNAGRTVIHVTGGEEVPVSRTFLAAVRNVADEREIPHLAEGVRVTRPGNS